MLKNRSLLTLADFTKEEISNMLSLALRFKKAKRTGMETMKLTGKNIALIFEKDSTRTRCAFEVAAFDQGAHITYLGPTGSQIGKKESIKDTARVLGRMYHAIGFRGHDHRSVEDLAKYSGVPVWNGLTDTDHPTQALADLMILQSAFKTLEGLKVVFCGNGRNNVTNALLIACSIMGINFTLFAPKKYQTDPELLEKCQGFAKVSGAKIEMTEDIDKAAKGAHAVYTDVWVSMGEAESTWKERLDLLMPYQVNKAFMDKTLPESIFMHCMPAFHDEDTIIGKEIADKFGIHGGLEVTDEVFESKKSVVFEQAENRMHTIKAVMVATLGKEN